MLAKSERSIFPFPGDFVVFFIPVLVAALVAMTVGQIGYAPKSDYFLLTVFFVWLTDAGHIFATTFLLLVNRAFRERLGHRLVTAPFTVLISIAIIIYLWPAYFPVLLGYVALSHIVMQHYGWLRLMQRRDRDLTEAERKLELVLFILLVGLPIYFWHTGNSSVELSYFIRDNLILRVPEWPGHFLSILYCLSVIVLSAWLVRIKSQNPMRLASRLPFYAVTVIWWYGGLVLSPVDGLFWICLITCHGWSYLLHTGRLIASNSEMPKWSVIFAFVTAIVLAGGFWEVARSGWVVNEDRPLSYIVWMPLFLHYVYDSIIWTHDFQSKISRPLL